ncbi:MAG: hypothetical protein ACI83O_000283 [Patescibacteria group bacterium]|jgi:hypothetical protein
MNKIAMIGFIGLVLIVLVLKNIQEEPQLIDNSGIQSDNTNEEVTSDNEDNIVVPASDPTQELWEEITIKEVLSQDTGHRRNYGKDPYGNYYEDSFLIFPVNNEDNRIHAKTPVLGIQINEKYKAYQENDVIDQGIITDTFEGITIELTKNKDGTITIINKYSGEDIVRERDFWFAWYAFHPETELY